MIDARDAAYIAKSTPGPRLRPARARLARPVPGRPGRRPAARHRPGAVTAAPWLAPVDWPGLGRPEPARPAAAGRGGGGDHRPEGPGRADPARRAAGCASPRQPSPWLPPLPPSAAAAPTSCRLPGQAWPDGWRAAATCAFGLTDLPARQQQQPAVLSLDTFSHLMAAGAPRSGRSQLLRTIAGALALAHSCADVHLYGIDCGNGALLPLTDLPHCGAVVSRTADRAGHPAAQAPGRRAEQAAGTARRRRVRRHHRAAGRVPRGRAAAAHRRAARPVGGVHHHARANSTAAASPRSSPGCSARAPAPACTW